MNICYRPAYDSLKRLPTQFPGVSLMALTATATSSVMDHLKQLLGDPVCEISSVNKTNITYQVFEIKPQGIILYDSASWYTYFLMYVCHYNAYCLQWALKSTQT